MGFESIIVYYRLLNPNIGISDYKNKEDRYGNKIVLGITENCGCKTKDACIRSWKK